MRALASSLVVLLLLAASSCSRDSAEYGRCDTILDCHTGQACGADGYCGAGAAVPVAIYGIELMPATQSGSGPVRGELANVPLEGGDIALEFAPPVTLSGRVLVAEDANQTQRSIGAAVTITRRSRIGLADATYSVDSAAGMASGEGAFSLRLPPTAAATKADCLAPEGDCYELRVVPSDLNSLPPLVDWIPVPGDTQIEVPLTGNLDVFQVHGTIKDAALNGVDGLEVRAVDGDGRTVSSVVTTRADAENVGNFLLTMSRKSVVGQVWLQVSETQANPGVPRFLYAFEAEGGGDVQLGDVVLLDFQAPVSVTYRVKGSGSNGQDQGIEGALVRFTSYLTAVFPMATPSKCPGDSCAVYTRQATTDANGEVTLTLIPPGPSGYEVDILPGPNSPYSALHTAGVEVDQPGVAADFTLTRKLEIRGAVTNSAGTPIVGATVTATPREVSAANDAGGGLSPSAMKTADLALDEPPATMQTDEAGQFLLTLEPGVSYDVVVAPSSSSPDPITTLERRQFQGAGTLNIQLPEAAVLAGTVAAWDGSDTAGTRIRVYEVRTDPDTTEPTAWLRGEAVAASDGTFKLVLPAAAATVQ